MATKQPSSKEKKEKKKPQIVEAGRLTSALSTKGTSRTRGGRYLPKVLQQIESENKPRTQGILQCVWLCVHSLRLFQLPPKQLKGPSYPISLLAGVEVIKSHTRTNPATTPLGGPASSQGTREARAP